MSLLAVKKWPGHPPPSVAIATDYLNEWAGLFSVLGRYVKDAQFGCTQGDLFSKRRYKCMRFRNVEWSSVALDNCEFESCAFEDCLFSTVACTRKFSFTDCQFDNCQIENIYGYYFGENNPINEVILPAKIRFRTCDFLDCLIAAFSLTPAATGAFEYCNFNNVEVRSSFNNEVVFRHDNNGVVDAGRDRRGYHFFGFWYENQWMVMAGCRWFTKEAAIDHWNSKGNKDALARVKLIMVHNKPVFTKRMKNYSIADATP